MSLRINGLVVFATTLGVHLTAGLTANAQTVSNLPLQRGFYVSTSTACGTASNATLSLVTKTGMSSSQVESKFQKIEKTGPTTYSVTEVWTEMNGRASPPRVITYDVPNSTSYRLKNEFGTFEFRFCPQTSLPAPWRNNDIRAVIN
jgi:hypothetical protein